MVSPSTDRAIDEGEKLPELVEPEMEVMLSMELLGSPLSPLQIPPRRTVGLLLAGGKLY
jgi:hypothetical protein